MHANHTWTCTLILTLTALFAGPFARADTKTSLLYFDADLANAVDFGNPAELRFTSPDPFTVEGWVRLDKTGAHDIMYGFHERVDGALTRRNPMYLFGLRNGNVAAYGNGSGWVEAASATVQTGTWHHLAFSVAANWDSVTLFLDGAEVGSGAFSATAGRANTFCIGSYSGDAYDVTGYISHVRVWDHARNAAQIQADMHAELTGYEPGLAACWPLDDGSGSSVSDISPNGNNGRVVIYVRNSYADGWRHLVLADMETGSPDFTDTSTVDIALLPAPPGYTHVEITESSDPASLTGSWTAIASMPGQATFTDPATDANVTLYAWMTNTSVSLSVPLKYLAGSIVYTTAEPQAIARSGLPRKTAGFTVRITPEAIDAGSTGGMYDGQPVDIAWMEALAVTPSDDATPDAPYVTLTGPGTYDLKLKVVNAAGAVATSAVCTVVIETAADAPSDGARYVAVGNLNAESPYDTWTTAAASIHDAVSDPQTAAGDTIRVWPGRYTAPTNAVFADDSVNVVNVTQPIILHATGGADDTLIDGEGLNRGIRIAYNDTTTNFVLQGFTVTNCFARNGGAVYYAANNNLSRYVDTRLSGNTAGYSGGAMYTAGATVELRESLLYGNRALAIRGGALYTVGSSVEIVNTAFETNTANTGTHQMGAAIFASGGSYLIENARFMDNKASPSGNAAITSGSLGLYGLSSLVMRNCLIVGGMGHRGGALRIENCTDVALHNCTITDNASASSSGNGRAGVKIKNVQTAEVYNCIIVENRRSGTLENLDFEGVTDAVLAHTCTEPAAVHPDGEAAFAAHANITDAPSFVDAANRDFRLSPPPDSPGLDAGINQDWMIGATDLDGRPRIDSVVGIVDMGCYEYNYRGTIILLR